ncbi:MULTISPECIES: TetR/AcrR family transcriptional regulator [Nocardia]|uniref:TetR/AcrR family transcriptional regulator n=1 Tax=Nocardia TaxID=1817 RepID=UPI000AAA6DD3|nr:MULTISPECIES: TetR/AcrR family transcriptional regulator [Nocardia]MBF6275004.1 TetR/AcrR family transcriptional regulator [Nocardia nova]MBV7706435.1 TetR/AcrR family transcriptional regulator [Nocardia nova]
MPAPRGASVAEAGAPKVRRVACGPRYQDYRHHRGGRTVGGIVLQPLRGKEQLLRALLEDFAAEGDTSAEASAHDPDFTKPAAVEFHIEQYWTFARRNWPVLRAVTQAALVDEELARLANRFTAGQLEEVVDHVDGFGAAGLRLPSTPDVSVAMMFLLIRALLEAVEEGVVAVDDEQAVAGLTRFVYRGLTGRDY